MGIAEEKDYPNPKERAGPISLITFWYTSEIFKKGYSKDLDVEDLYNPLKKDKSAFLGDSLQQGWTNEVNRARRSKSKPSLLRAIFSSFWFDLIYATTLSFLSRIIKIFPPIFLEQLLNYFSPNRGITRNEVLIYVGLLSLCSILGIVISHQTLLKCCHMAMKFKAACCAVMYRKTLKMTGTALGRTSSAEIINLLSNDMNRLDSATLTVNLLLSGPIVTITIMIILYQKSGLVAILGVLVIFSIGFAQSFLGKLSAKYRKRIASRTDERVRLLEEIITGIQVIKMYAWEKPFRKLMTNARKAEVDTIAKAAFVKATFLASSLYNARVALFCTLFTFVLTDEEITASRVFVIASYYQTLASSTAAHILRAVADLAELRVVFRRVENFLLNEEFDTARDQMEVKQKMENLEEDTKDVINMKNLTVKWNSDHKENALERVNLNIPVGLLVGVIGPVGGGKSSLLRTILGGLETIDGHISIRGKKSYASQDPWIFAASIRENIIFNEEYDEKRYQRVIDVCGLQSDLKQFKRNDLTVVGDRGASLSGGQKARINLARAVYRDADIYLLDDPLSAVDVHVSKHIYKKCIRDFLARKTIILVTHQVHYVEDADHIVIINKGHIEDQGTMKMVSNSENEYAKLLFSNSQNETPRSGILEYHSEERTEDEDELVDGENEQTKLLPKTEGKKLIGSMASLASRVSTADLLPLKDEERIANQGKEFGRKDNIEKSSKGEVKDNLLFKYLTVGSSVFAGILLFTIFIGNQLTISAVDYWVSYWVNIEEFKNHSINSTVTGPLSIPLLNLSTETCLYIYVMGLMLIVLTIAARTLFFFKLVMMSSKKLHATMYDSVTGATMNFFDTNPSGRILNRFTKDMGIVDEYLSAMVFDSAQYVLMTMGSLLLIVVVNPLLMILIGVFGIIFTLMGRVYLKSSKNMKRLEGRVKSPIFSHIKETLDGITTIRAFGAEDALIKEFDSYQDCHSSAWFIFISLTGAFGFWLDVFSTIFVIILSFSFVLFEESLGMRAGEVGLAITQSMTLIGIVQWGIKIVADVANNLLSVERVLEYKTIPREIQPIIPQTPPVAWPERGEVILKNMNLRYSENGPLILKNLNITIKPREKVGVVGRTGAGKSSLIQALFRLAPIEGSIEIDGIDTVNIGLHYLRSKISIIPQDPVLFSGTLRYNLDPFQKYTDDVLYKALEDVELNGSYVINDLDDKVMNRGSNFSVGQRQLICLARAILKRNRILTLDEATANVDPQTDALIQQTIREKFADCTVITIAHRLNTIMDSDKVLVMDDGKVLEFDHPYFLLQNKEGVFHRMVMETGGDAAAQLKKIAFDSYQKYQALIE